MARYTGPVCRICRRENQKLFLKGDRCMTEKCAFERRAYPPGQHGHGRVKFSEYALQLREKQKLKRMYGLVERQFRSLFEKAERAKGVTGTNLLGLLERRLDNVAYRMGVGASRTQARMLVSQGHLLVNGRRVNIPSFTVKKGDVVAIAEKSQKITTILASMESAKNKEAPQWVEVDRAAFKATIKDLPARDDITAPVEERMVVELYSK
ncbi:MAG: 30S ribosomal protein S4, partial [Bdellovibrionales bacterium]|nr:30S ribosomal protein S4 [Bdellovibrionales bacterium]